jgi:hypothetical protein
MSDALMSAEVPVICEVRVSHCSGSVPFESPPDKEKTKRQRERGLHQYLCGDFHRGSIRRVLEDLGALPPPPSQFHQSPRRRPHVRHK